MLPDGIRAVVKKDSYEVPAIFRLMQKKGNITDEMMYNTYNMGLGMVLALDPADVDKTMEALKAAGETAYVVGTCETGEKSVTIRVVVLVSGGGTNLQAIIDAIAAGKVKNAQIVGVISNNKTVKSLERARNAGIPAVCVSPKDYESREVFNEALLAKVKEFAPDLIVLAGFLVKIPEAMVHEYSNRIINIHPSLIPSFCGVGYYGLHVHEKALERGVKVTGATVHFVNEGMDEGPIIAQKAVAVEDDDTPETLQRRVMEQAEWLLLPKAVDDIANGRICVVNGKVKHTNSEN